jgi:hypothetical protein
VFEAVADGIGDDRIGDDFAPVIEWQLRCEERGFIDRSLLEQLAQVLCFCGRELAHSRVVRDDQVGFGELVAIS